MYEGFDPNLFNLTRVAIARASHRETAQFLYHHHVNEVNMKGKVCVVTGSNSGIGKETAKALARMGATVVMAVRSRERGESARTEIVEASGNEAVDVMVCDVSSKESIGHFVGEFESRYDRLDVLINNAGAVFGRRENSVDGFESTLAVNYLGPFRLTLELLPMLRRGAPSRVVNVSSGMHKTGKMDLNDLQGNHHQRRRT